MFVRTVPAAVFALCLCLFIGTGCQAPYKKKDEEEKIPLKDQSSDTSFQAFLGRLRIAVAKRDHEVLTPSSTMTAERLTTLLAHLY